MIRRMLQAGTAAAMLIAGTMSAGEQTFTARVLRVGDSYGNLDTDLAAEALGLPYGAAFRLECGDRSFEATWTVWYSEVPPGDWLGLANEDGNVQLAINGDDADAVCGCGVGDVLTIRTSGSP